MLPNYFDYIFVYLRHRVRLWPILSPKFLSTLGPNPTQKARPHLQLCAAGRWQHCVRFDHSQIGSSDFQLQRRMRLPFDQLAG